MAGLTNPLHLAFIAMIALIFLGPKRLPDLAKSLGSGMREFRDSISGEHKHDAAHLPAAETPAPVPAANAPAPAPNAPAPAPPPAPPPPPAPAPPAAHSAPDA